MGAIGEVARTGMPRSRTLPLDGLHRLSTAVNRAERLEQIYEAALEALLDSLGADRASILLFDNLNLMRFVAWHGLSAVYRQAVEGHSPWTADDAEAQPILVSDVCADKDLAPYRDTIVAEGIRALAFVPLIYGSRLLGKFMVYFNEPHEFTPEESLLAQTIANHVGFAIEQKRTEQNLRRYRKIFEHSPAAIGIVGPEGHYVEQNEAHRDLIGYSIAELRTETPAIHLGVEGFRKVAAELRRAEAFVGEMVSTTKDGRQTPIDLTAFVVRDEEGRPECLVGMKQDISARKESERRVQQIQQELEDRVLHRTAQLRHANEEMEGFCYSVSHDLRAPLRGMNAAAKMLLEDYSHRVDEDGREHLERLCATSTRMSELIDDLLQYSRLGRKEIVREPVDLASLARTALEEVRSRFAGGDLIEFTLEEVPMVNADPRLMEIVLHNLIENAVKFTAGREGAVVRFGHRDSAFFVRDNGVGFDQQYASKLFRPFERLHTETDFPGTGIGLANVKRIVERHGGAVWCEAAPGGGATFWFSVA